MQIKKIHFIDGSTIEKNKSGNIYTGSIANHFGHAIRQHNITLEDFIKYLLETDKGKDYLISIK